MAVRLVDIDALGARNDTRLSRVQILVVRKRMQVMRLIERLPVFNRTCFDGRHVGIPKR